MGPSHRRVLVVERSAFPPLTRAIQMLVAGEAVVREWVLARVDSEPLRFHAVTHREAPGASRTTVTYKECRLSRHQAPRSGRATRPPREASIYAAVRLASVVLPTCSSPIAAPQIPLLLHAEHWVN